jgi:Flp pilus assembly protein TadD
MTQHYAMLQRKKVPRTFPAYSTALRIRGLALARAGESGRGLELLREALTLAPREPLARLHYGIGLHAARQFREAADAFRDCLALLPNNPAAPLNLAAALLELGDIDGARSAALNAVALAATSAEAHYTLGLVEASRNALDAARTAFEAALSINPKFADCWVSLGRVHYQLGNIGEATRSMNQAISLRPGHGVAHANLAVFESLRGEYATAFKRLRNVLDADPNCIPARINLASQLLNDREPAQALQLLDREPPNGQLGVHWRAQKAGAMILLNRDAEARQELETIGETAGEGELLVLWRRLVLSERGGDLEASRSLAERMTRLAGEQTGALLEHRIMAHFELARYYYPLGEREVAFDHWKLGHGLLGRTQPFAREVHQQFISASKEAFSFERLHNGPRALEQGAAALFVVGLPRSGTTLVEQILSAHPAIYGGGERAAIFETLAALGPAPATSQSVLGAAKLDRPILTEIGRSYLSGLRALSPNAQYVTDKMPGNALHLGYISTILPSARVIRCIRDPRDIGLSIFQFRFFGYHPYAHDLADLGWYIGKHQELMDHWQKVLPIPQLTVRLVDWVNDFSGTLRQVLEFLDLSYDRACEEFYLQDRKVRTASQDQVRYPVNARGLNRWREYEHRLEPLITELRAAGVGLDQYR